MGKGCDAILDFQDGHFIWCELEEDHKGNHKALNFEWEGGDITKGHCSDRLRGLNLFKLKLEKFLKK